MSDNHPNSRKITIFRTGSFLSRAQKGIDDHFADAKVSVGSYFEKGSRKIASGLTFGEEELLLPNIIDIPKEDRAFRAKVTEFYSEMDTQIPAGNGLTLEIGLEADNASPVGKDNLPLNLMDYLRWRHAKGHPWMAVNKEEGEGNANKQYYIFDKDEIKNKSVRRNQDKDAALQIYLQLKNDMSKVDMMLTLMNIDPREFTGKQRDEDKIEALRALSETQPDKFNTTFKDADFEIRYWIQAMINTRVIEIAGGKYYNTETKKLLGNTIEEMIYFFKDEDNSDQVIILKGIFQEAVKRAPEKKKATTQALRGKTLKS